MAVAANTRMSAFKDVPTFAEAGYKDMEITAWTGLFAPAGTPRDVLDKLNAVVKTHVESEEAMRFRARSGGFSIWSSVDDAQKFLTAEQRKWQRFMDSTGIQPFL
jgi:tripartite-type tricarboxylate transporter receptor subunit TctC